MKYFEIKDLLKKYPNKLIYTVISARGYGKSYSIKRKFIEDFLEKGYQCIILRRYKVQVEEMMLTYFNDVLKKEEKFKKLKVVRKNNEVFINGDLFCTFLALNSSAVGRGSAYPLVHNIMYEEIMPEPGERVIKNEYKKLESFIVTVDRFENRVTLFCVGNNTGYYSPLFDSLKLYPTVKKEGYTQNESMVIMKAQSNNEFKEQVYNTRVGKLTKLSGTSKYNIENENISNDRFNVVSKKLLKETNKLKPIFSVRVDKDKIIKIWKCEGNNYEYYWIDNNSSQNVDEFFFDYEYQNNNNKHITLLNKYLIDKIELYNKIGNVYFNNPETKYYFNQIKLFYSNSLK